MKQVERIHLEFGPEWGAPEIAHMVLRQMRDRRGRRGGPRGLMVLYGASSGLVPPVDLQVLNQQ